MLMVARLVSSLVQHCCPVVDVWTLVLVLLDPLPDIVELRQMVIDRRKGEASFKTSTAHEPRNPRNPPTEDFPAQVASSSKDNDSPSSPIVILESGKNKVSTMAKAESAVDPEQGNTEYQHDRTTSDGKVPIMLQSLASRGSWTRWLRSKRVSKSRESGKRRREVIIKRYCAFEGFAPRLPFINYRRITSPDYQIRLSQQMEPTNSTLTTLEQALDPGDDLDTVKPLQPTVAICMIIQNDTMHFFSLMDYALTEIGESILVDSLIQRNIDRWRILLNRYDVELRQIEASLQNLSDYLLSTGNVRLNDTNAKLETSILGRLSSTLTERISDVRQRTERVNTSLMTTMSLMENKRGIAEAESVTKLTELAFFFIPLTFSASIFSMQVKELSASATSVSAFVVVAMMVTAGSYALRLAVRSRRWVNLWQRMQRNIKAHAQLVSSATIPTTSFLTWICHATRNRLGALTITIALSTMLVAVILSTMWPKHLEIGLKVAITVVLVILYLLFLTYSAIARLRKRKFRQYLT